MTDSASELYLRVLRRIVATCLSCGRDPREVTLVGACKRQPMERLVAAHRAGLKHFGENLVQEAVLHRQHLPPDIEWHLIGPLQTNKVNKAVRTFTWIHSIDRPKIARALDKAAQKAAVSIHGLIEVNLGDEASKHGFAPQELETALDELVELQHLRLEGLMAIPPFEETPEGSRGWFRQLRQLRDRIFERPQWSDRAGYLSMGMSGDFGAAIEEGATHVRVGTSLFGARNPRRPE